jgi:mRNA-degrading endonuclease toxin of MazEF toxin-antitoxin module
VLSSDILNERRRTVVVVPLSTAPQPSPPILVPVECAGRAAVAVTDQIRAVSKERLQSLIGRLAPADLDALEEGVREILELG